MTFHSFNWCSIRYPCIIRCYNSIYTKYFLWLYPIQCYRRIYLYLAPSFIGSWYAITFLTFFVFVQLLILQGIEVTTMEEGRWLKKITFSNHHRKYFVLHIRLYIVNILLYKSSLQPKQIKTHIFSALHYFQTEFYCIAQFLCTRENRFKAQAEIYRKNICAQGY